MPVTGRNLLVAACSAMILGALVPVVLAHNQSPALGDADANVLLNPPHVDNDRNAASGGDRNGVSGRYVSSWDGVFVNVSGLTPVTLGDITLFPGGTFQVTSAATICDMEILGPGDGGGLDALLDETSVDNDPVGLLVPNGLWDDGGLGGACHFVGFADPSFDAPGCPQGKGVNAEDSVSGGAVWIGAGCDTTTAPIVDPPSLFFVALCAANAVLQEQPGQVDDCVMGFLGCFLEDCTIGLPPICGSDGIVDSISYGRGNGHGAPEATFRGNPDCPSDTGSAVVFVFDAVRVDLASPLSPSVSLATTGWIEQHA